MGSRRLPGKMLLDLAGRPLLGRVLDRVRQIDGGHTIVVATSELKDDDAIAEFAAEECVCVFRGSHDDVAGRALACCESHGFERFARICGDRPFLPWELVNELLEIHANGDFDLVTNAFEPGHLPGTMTEIMSTAALRRIVELTDDADDREHVTRYIYAHPEDFKISDLCPELYRGLGLRLSVDGPADVARTQWIIERLSQEPESARLEQVVALAAEWENIRKQL